MAGDAPCCAEGQLGPYSPFLSYQEHVAHARTCRCWWTRTWWWCVSVHISCMPAKPPTSPPTHWNWAAFAGCGSQRARKFTLFLLKYDITVLFQLCMYSITPHMLWAYCSCGFQWEASNFQEDKFCFLKSSQASKRTTQAIWSSFFYVHRSQMKQERFPNSKMWCCLPPEMSLRPPSSGSNSMLLSSWLDTTTYWYQHLLGFPVKTVGNRICLWKQPFFFSETCTSSVSSAPRPTL